MKKLVLFVAAMALVTSVSMAQVSLADIYGTVVLPDGSAIPGVTVTLTGDVVGKMTGVTSEEGNFRFLKLSPGNYELKFELDGFKTVVRKGIRLFVGKNVTLTIPMETTTIKEEVIVTATAGVVDTRKTLVGMNVTKEMIQSLPTARNPWTVMGLVPGLMLDRVDVGGTDSGQQSNIIAGGADRDDSTWNVDGANITDPSAIGSSPAYLNVNSLEEIQVTVGANDITAQTGGVQLNFVTKKAGNRYAGDFHLYISDKAWELKQDLTPYMVRRNFVNPGVNRLYQYGINYGGPIIKDKWFWNGSWGVQDIHGRTITNVEDATWLVMGYFKTNFQLGNTSGDFHMTYDNKLKWGRTKLSPAQQNNGSLWDQSTPGYLYYGAVQHIFGNLMLEAKAVYTDGGFVLDPRGANVNPLTGHNEGAEWNFYRVPRLDLDAVYQYGTNRNMINASLTGNYFAENVLGGDHEIRFGVDYVTATTTTQSLYPNQRIAYSLLYDDPSYYQAMWLIPDWTFDVAFKRTSFYLQDTMTFGKLVVNLGLRYDKEQGSLNDYTLKKFTWHEPGTPYDGIELFSDRLGALTIPKTTVPASYTLISPRLSLTYDITGDGKNVAKLSLGRYGSQSGNNLAYYLAPPAREIDVMWYDDGDGKPEYNELGHEVWTNTDTFDYVKKLQNVKFASDFNTPILDEITVSYERQLGEDMALALTGFYKRRHNLITTKGIMDAAGTLETQSNWYVYSTKTIDGVATPLYARHESPIGTYYYNYEKAYDQYMAAQLVLTKKLSHKWMADASFFFMDWTSKRFKEEAFRTLNGFDYFNGGVNAPETQGSGLADIWINASWSFKLSGLYQLPWNINLTGVVQVREGYPIFYQQSFNVSQGNVGLVELPKGGTKFGDDRLPTNWIVNLGLEKTFKISDTTTAVLFVDLYNATNNQQTMKVDNSWASARKGEALMVTNQGVFQFGVRVNF